MSVRPDLDALARLASHKKVKLDLPPEQSTYLKEILLRISQMSLQAFDALDQDRISEHELFIILQMPDYVNVFSQAVREHAESRLLQIKNQRPQQEKKTDGRTVATAASEGSEVEHS